MEKRKEGQKKGLPETNVSVQPLSSWLSWLPPRPGLARNSAVAALLLRGAWAISDHPRRGAGEDNDVTMDHACQYAASRILIHLVKRSLLIEQKVVGRPCE